MGRRRYSRQGGGAGAGAGLGCLVLLAGVVVLWLVVVVVGAIIAVFSTPYPWIALGLGALGYGAFHGTRTFRRQRLHKLFFDAVASIHAAEPRARELLPELQQEGGDQADAQLLIAAAAARDGEYQEALLALERAAALLATAGQLSGGIDLKFPGVPIPIWFGAHP